MVPMPEDPKVKLHWPPVHDRTQLALDCDLHAFCSHIRIFEMTARFSQDFSHALIVMFGIVMK
jgi:hypothetical protein